ncbi:unnamed protein product [Toxocara canis]|nr:unnamed protein product [Toxocara canis]
MFASTRSPSNSSLGSDADEHDGSSGEKQSPINITKEIID